MKKLIMLLVVALVISFFPVPTFSGDQKEEKLDVTVIPDDAIRLRILANSDDEKDQQVKRQIRDAVNEEVTKWVEEMADIEKARNLIESRLPEIDEIVKNELQKLDLEISHTVDYDDSVEFPTKLYGDYLYPAGKYEAILITLGEGKGANWWCVVFPPLCFLDFSFGTTVEDHEQEKEAEDKEAQKDQQVTDKESSNSNKESEEKQEDDEEIKFQFFFMTWFN
ncbi:stage II sporulation protein R [Saliterribacillus persicus]|uniref:Stage II sporulation protein R n=1 Tax=Saliterribacillus persicus TaxID=930114 RepID=A0A368YCQ1_9BACI|nr:stage II sporulation protein R [Saliterribacillus persicus]RCW77449.1 stage II sporulation protein R [Saliterribacillus persicus]